MNPLMQPLSSECPLIVYLDFKSPYAYLAWRPVAEMALELGITVDWRPFVLDIPSYLGSAKLGGDGRVVTQERSTEQWSGVKYAYFDCRRYANLRGLTVRGTVKIWDTNLAAVGMLWAKQQGDEVLERYIDGIYEPFWKRQLDVEQVAEISRVLVEAGACVDGFDSYALGEGRLENDRLQTAAFDAGIYGVPSFVVAGNLYFGREHLPRIRWHLTGEMGAAPDIAYPLRNEIVPGPVADSLEICIDFHCPQSYLALKASRSLVAELGIPVDWCAKLSPSRGASPPLEDSSRGARHRRRRADDRLLDLGRYAPHEIEATLDRGDSSAPAMALLWLRDAAPSEVERFVVTAFEHIWRHGQRLNGIASVASLLGELGLDGEAFESYAAAAGGVALQEQQEQLVNRGVIGTPTYLLGEEPFLGRQHLPLIRARLGLGNQAEPGSAD